MIVAYITVTDNDGIVQERITINDADVRDEIAVADTVARRGGRSPFQMIVLGLEEEIARGIEIAYKEWQKTDHV